MSPRWIAMLSMMLMLAVSAPAEAGIGSLIKAAVKAGSKAGSAGAKAGAKAGAAGAKAGAKGAAAAKAGAAAAKGVGAVALADGVFRYADDVGGVGLYVTRQGDGVSGVMRHGDELAEVKGTVGGMVDEAAKVGDDLDVYVDESALGHLSEIDEAANARLYLANADGPSMPLRKGANGAAEVLLDEDFWLELTQSAIELGVDVALDLAQQVPPSFDREILTTDPDCHTAIPSLEAAPEHWEPGDTVLILVVGDLPATNRVEAMAEEADVDLIVARVEDVCGPGASGLDAVAEPFGDDRPLLDTWRAFSQGEAQLDQVGEAGMTVRSASLVAAHGYAAEAPPPWWAQAIATCLCCGCPLVGALGVVWLVVQAVRKRGEG